MFYICSLSGVAVYLPFRTFVFLACNSHDIWRTQLVNHITETNPRVEGFLTNMLFPKLTWFIWSAKVFFVKVVWLNYGVYLNKVDYFSLLEKKAVCRVMRKVWIRTWSTPIFWLSERSWSLYHLQPDVLRIHNLFAWHILRAKYHHWQSSGSEKKDLHGPEPSSVCMRKYQFENSPSCILSSNPLRP